MNLLSSFSDFYRGLSSDGVFFFWIILFLICFLLFLTIVLVIKNKKLMNLLREEVEVSDVNIDIIKEEVPSVKEEEVEEEIEKKVVIEDTPKIEEPTLEEESGPYKKNVLREISARTQTSPISITKNSDVKEDNTIGNENYDFDEICLREDSVSPLEEMEDIYEVNDSMKFANDIVEKMEEEIKPSNIELTDYEKKQEEEAIISYDELLKVKDKIYNITEDEETDEFIDQLKSFRLDL